MIIDPHVHIGHDTTWDSNRTEDEVFITMEKVGVTVAIVQPAQYVTFEDYHYSHNRIYDWHLKRPKRIFGMFSMNPHFDEDLYRAEARRCMQKLGFVGIKLTPLTHLMSAYVKRANLPFEMASELSVPLMIHQGSGVPNSLISTYYQWFKKYPQVTVVLAHSGGTDTEDEDIIMAKEFPNIYLECSVRSPNIHNIEKFVDEIGSERVMYASDSPDEMAHMIWECQNGRFTEEQSQDLLWRTACEAYNLKHRIDLK